MYCSKCGYSNPDDNRFCSSCGLPLKTGSDISSSNRLNAFSNTLTDMTLRGWQVSNRDDRIFTAVLTLPAKKVNHVLHALLSLFLCGIWLIPWIWLAMTAQSEQRIKLSVDENLRVTKTKF